MKEILVCGGTGCISGDSRLVHDALEQELSRQGLEAEFKLKYTGCHGFCEQGPVILVTPQDNFYCKVKPQDVPHLIASLKQGKVYEELLYVEPTTKERILTRHDVPFYKNNNAWYLRTVALLTRKILMIT